jgi:hypothetical protein
MQAGLHETRRREAPADTPSFTPTQRVATGHPSLQAAMMLSLSSEARCVLEPAIGVPRGEGRIPPLEALAASARERW